MWRMQWSHLSATIEPKNYAFGFSNGNTHERAHKDAWKRKSSIFNRIICETLKLKMVHHFDFNERDREKKSRNHFGVFCAASSAHSFSVLRCWTSEKKKIARLPINDWIYLFLLLFNTFSRSSDSSDACSVLWSQASRHKNQFNRIDIMFDLKFIFFSFL